MRHVTPLLILGLCGFVACSQVMPDAKGAADDDAAGAGEANGAGGLQDAKAGALDAKADGKVAGKDGSKDTGPKACPHPPGPTEIDGDFSPGEWDCATPLAGQFGHLFLRLEGSSLHVLNDWNLRDDQTISPNMYNQFQFSTGDGAQSWEVRVYGDGHAEVRKDGGVVDTTSGAYGFHPSQFDSKPHTIFEFALPGVLPGGLCMTNHDPGSAASLGWVAPSTKIAGEDNPDAANVAEPVTFVAVLDKDGSVTVQPASGPLLVALLPPTVGPGADVTVLATGLGAQPGQVLADGVAMPVLAWAPGQVTFLAPGTTGTVHVKAVVQGVATNELNLKVQGLLPIKCDGLPDGRLCDDGNACTASDACKQGKCAGSVVSCDDGDACTSDPCVPGSGCAHAPASCDDGDACTVDACSPVSGCSHTAKVCTDDNPCTTDGCSGGTCTSAATGGGPCDDGNACSQGDHCQDGACLPGGPVVCDDGNSCTADFCTPQGGCSGGAQPGMGCSDGSLCTVGDGCQGGVCKPGALQTCDDGNPCTSDQCDPQIGCVFTIQAGSACDDGNVCTTSDICLGKVCTGAAVPVPKAQGCWKYECDAKTGTIAQVALSGTPCDDGVACNQPDTCLKGACVGKPVLCDDGNPCTQDQCSGGTCSNLAMAEGVCDDGNACTLQDSCSGGQCGGKVLKCDDGDPKTTDFCEPDKGCVFQK